MVLTIILFLFLYAPRINLLPDSISNSALTSLTILIVFWFIKIFNGYKFNIISKKFLIIPLIFFLSFYTYITSTIFDIGDYTLSLSLIKIGLYIIFGLLFSISLFEEYESPLIVIKEFKYKLLKCIIFNNFIVLFSIILPGFESLIENFLLKPQSEETGLFTYINNPLVARGISSSAGAVHSASLYLISYITILHNLFEKGKNFKNPFNIDILYQILIILFSLFFIGRTGLIFYIFLFIPLVSIKLFNNLISKINFRNIFYLIILLTFAIFLLTYQNNLIEILNSPAFKEWIINAINSPRNDNSFVEFGLKSNLPQLSFLKFLFGAGSFQFTNDGIILPDSGYIRLFYGLGIIFFLVFYISITSYLYNSLSTCFKFNRYLTLIFLISLLILELKEPMFIANNTGRLIGLLIGLYLAFIHKMKEPSKFI